MLKVFLHRRHLQAFTDSTQTLQGHNTLTVPFIQGYTMSRSTAIIKKEQVLSMLLTAS